MKNYLGNMQNGGEMHAKSEDANIHVVESLEQYLYPIQKQKYGDYATNLSSEDKFVVKKKPSNLESATNVTECNFATKLVSSSEPTQLTPKVKPKRKTFKPDELHEALMPTLKKLYAMPTESAPFLRPVDPKLLDIPDYFDIIKKPMDLSTIKRKLETGCYEDPWQYVDDVWLMFDNAWLYNPETNIVHKYCSKLAEVFEQEIHPVMQSLGYCCGRKYTFEYDVVYCYAANCNGIIPRYANYWDYQHRYMCCMKCFSEAPGDNVTLQDLESVTIRKDQFIKMKHDHVEAEPFVECLDCGRKLHQICVLHFESIWPEGFTCDNCLKSKGKSRRKNQFTAKALKQSKLGQHIEIRVNKYLRDRRCGAGKVTIRVVSSSKKNVEVKPGMKAEYVDSGEWPDKFPYTSKALFAFEEIDGVDVCFFGMYVQEYGSDCPVPNSRRVYIAYLDSVHFFHPKQYRTAVYYEIILGYLSYVKQLGYTMAHIWAVPPSEGEDFIFPCHPKEQRVPNNEKLQYWYRAMLRKGMDEKILVDFKNILHQAAKDKIECASKLPYFDGDFWPDYLESILKSEDDHLIVKAKAVTSVTSGFTVAKQREDDDAKQREDNLDNEKENKKNVINNKYTKRRANKRKRKASIHRNSLWEQIHATIKSLKEEFLVLHLHSTNKAGYLRPIVDPDPLIFSKIMDDRDEFFSFAKKYSYEFSSLRRTKFSTMGMLHELHKENK